MIVYDFSFTLVTPDETGEDRFVALGFRIRPSGHLLWPKKLKKAHDLQMTISTFQQVSDMEVC